MDDRKRNAIEWHLKNNHSPPAPAFIIDAACQLIELAEDCGDNEGFWDEPMTFDADGQIGKITKKGRDVTRGDFREDWHLDEFINEGD